MKISCKNEFLIFKKMKIDVKLIRAPKVPFNFQFKIEIKKDIFAHFIFYFKIENWKMIKNFQFSIINFYWKIENWKFIFHFSIFEFNCRITQVEKPWLTFFNPISWSDVEFLSTKEKEKTLFYCNSLKRNRSRNSNKEKGYT